MAMSSIILRFGGTTEMLVDAWLDSKFDTKRTPSSFKSLGEVLWRESLVGEVIELNWWWATDMLLKNLYIYSA